MDEKTWRDADHPSYCGRLTHTCLGCRKRCAKSAWGPWCHQCNVKRMTSISNGTAQLTQARFEEIGRTWGYD